MSEFLNKQLMITVYCSMYLSVNTEILNQISTGVDLTKPIITFGPFRWICKPLIMRDPPTLRNTLER